MSHLSEETLERIARGSIAPTAGESDHLQSCQECAAIISGLMRADTGFEATARSPRRSGGSSVVHEVIGRYRVTKLLGEGAMGRVFEANDPELHRAVAVKVVRGANNPEMRARLQREAQAAARVKHPNVVTVYDVGTVGEEVFVAMELVAGGSLRGWLKGGRREWADVVRVFTGAGRGLAAVHDAGLVHRDFKPDNVLLDADGTARVSDFGLVGVERNAAAGAPVEPASSASTATPALTQTGTLMGTPAYMAPELFAGQPATPASDQFAFCVSLYEALSGHRPFKANSFDELKAAVQRGADVEAPPGAPAWLAKLVRRGLDADPARRFPSMTELVRQLDEVPRQRRRVTTLSSAAGVVVALVAGAAWLARPPPCGVFSVGDAWGPERRAEVSKGLEAQGVAPSLLATVLADLDAYAKNWVDAQSGACQAARVTRDQSEEQYTQRSSCLDRRRRELGALTHLLATADLGTARRAASLTGHLPAIASCADLEAMKSERPLPENPEERKTALEVREILAQCYALGESGHEKEALELARKADALLEKTGYAPLQAESKLRIGQLLSHLDDYDAADKVLREGLLLATSTGQDRLAAKTLGVIVSNLASAQRNGPELDTTIALATATLARVGNPDTELDDLLYAVGSVRQFQGRYDDAEKAFQQMLEIRQRLHGPNHPRVAVAWNALGVVHDNQGHLKQALEDYRRAEAIWLGSLGDNHPNLASNYNNIAIVLAALGEKEKALEAHHKALEIRIKVYGPESADVAQTYSNIAAEMGEGREVEALAEYQRARDIYVKRYGEENADVARVDESMGNALQRQKKFDEAMTYFQRSLKVREKLLGPEHFDVGRSCHAIGNQLGLTGHPAEALPWFERAGKIFEKTFGPNHAYLASTWSSMADAYFALKKWDDAAREYEHTLKVISALEYPDDGLRLYCWNFLADARDRQGRFADALAAANQGVAFCTRLKTPDPFKCGQANSVLAQTAWKAKDKATAQTAFDRGVKLLTEAGEKGATELKALEKWRAEHH
ncbi:MAG: serine/threonine-protein kinase [Myxococcaceae bacterium]